MWFQVDLKIWSKKKYFSSVSQVEILRNAIYYIESLEALLSESEQDETGRQKRWSKYLSSSCWELSNIEMNVTQKYCNLFWVVSVHKVSNDSMFQPLAHKRLSFRSWQFVVWPVYVVFSCPGQLNRWPCHSLTQWLRHLLISDYNDYNDYKDYNDYNDDNDYNDYND